MSLRRPRVVVAGVVAAFAVAATPATAHELTLAQERKLEHRWQLSTYVIGWYTRTRRGRWSLRPGFDRCAAIRWPRPRGRCFKHRENLRWHRGRRDRIHRLLAPPAAPAPVFSSPAGAICAVFGPYCSQAVAVASCESGLSIYARNGQYLGLFQMGDYARATYGHAWDAFGQARAAYRYFVASGFSWRPWECRP